MEYSPVACMRQSSCCCRPERLGCLLRKFPLARAVAMTDRGPTHHCMAVLNLLAAVVIRWNTVRRGEAVIQRKHAGLTVESELLGHILPLGWPHILLTGEYRRSKRPWRP